MKPIWVNSTVGHCWFTVLRSPLFKNTRAGLPDRFIFKILKTVSGAGRRAAREGLLRDQHDGRRA
jgi:hypothetical protein